MIFYKKKKNRNFIEELLDIDLPVIIPIPSYMPPQQMQQTYIFFGKDADMQKALTESILMKKDALTRFQDGSLEGLLKGTLVQKILEELKLNPSSRFPYLEAQISDSVDSGRYFRNYKEMKQSRNASQGKVGPGILMSLPEAGWMHKNIPRSQHNLYAKTGIYVKGGSVYIGRSAKPIDSLKFGYTTTTSKGSTSLGAARQQST